MNLLKIIECCTKIRSFIIVINYEKFSNFVN